MLSFTLSGKHTTYTYTHALILIYSKHITVTDIRICINSYRKLINILVLIADLYLSRFPVGVTELNFNLIRYSDSYHITIGIPRPLIRNE